MGLLVAVIAFAIVILATPVVRRVAVAFGVLDHPGPLKLHQEPVPYLGGAAVLIALVAVLAPTHASWLLPLALAAALGFADDIRNLSPRLRLGAQTAIGCIAGVVAPADVRLGFFVTAALVLVCINAVNLIDGLDALASAVVGLAALGFVFVGGDARVLALALLGALAGFLVFNWPPARIYLGDGGSYLVGTGLGLLAACSLERFGSGAWIALPFLVGLPLADLAITVVRRALARRPLFQGDRAHVYDQLGDRGWTVAQVVAVCACAQVATTALGLTVLHLPLAAAGGLAAASLAAITVFVWRAGLLANGATA
jgi:UDP-GlcNAc:undecaprenyl-phosphate GlcNAc-1-phosphate transferase